ncbi:LOW QUALITY PROTEIN: polyprenol reductase 2-like [Populus alba x Populus x berolinensis]|nr:LOW QUALITY PROTEIN: polyprenol reductase 2-like [Populus alba x Populus x berolinensis]
MKHVSFLNVLPLVSINALWNSFDLKHCLTGKGRPSCCKIKRLAYILTFTIMMGSLREHVGKVDEYVIPHGDWFEIVSSPHYLAEIVIYAGIVFGSGGADLTIWLLFGFVVSNLIFAAAETHRWYLQKFDNYPSNRVAIIPFLPTSRPIRWCKD